MWCTIIESNNISSILDHIKTHEYHDKTLVIFDIDNTIVQTPTSLASDQWVYANIDQKMKSGDSMHTALEKTLAIYYLIQSHIWLVTIEPCIVALIKGLQERKISVIALTARNVFIAHRTLEQLERLGIDFSRTSPQRHFCYHEGDLPILYTNGIIFAGNHDKGAILRAWLTQMNFRPTKIIFIDDKLKNVYLIQHALETTPESFIGIRYGRLDKQVKEFDMQEAEREYQQFLYANPEHKPITIIPAEQIS